MGRCLSRAIGPEGEHAGVQGGLHPQRPAGQAEACADPGRCVGRRTGSSLVSVMRAASMRPWSELSQTRTSSPLGLFLETNLRGVRRVVLIHWADCSYGAAGDRLCGWLLLVA